MQAMRMHFKMESSDGPSSCLSVLGLHCNCWWRRLTVRAKLAGQYLRAGTHCMCVVHPPACRRWCASARLCAWLGASSCPSLPRVRARAGSAAAGQQAGWPAPRELHCRQITDRPTDQTGRAVCCQLECRWWPAYEITCTFLTARVHDAAYCQHAANMRADSTASL